jgi:RND family efflux transporter MFP subunit
MPDDHGDILRHRPPGRLKLWGVILAGVALAAVAIGLTNRFVSSRATEEWTETQAIPTVQLITLKGTAGGDFTLPGEIQAFAGATLNAQVSGTIQRWYADIGTRVKAGQLLAQIDPRPYQAALAQAEGQLARDSATLANARVDLTRYQALSSQNAVSAQQLSGQQANVAQLSGVIASDRAAVETARINLGFTRVVAPFDGVVTGRSIDVGQLVSANGANSTPMFQLSDARRLRVYVRMPQSYSSMVHPGLSASFTVPEYPGRVFTATLAASAGAIVVQSGTQLLQMQLDNSDAALKPGSYAEMRFSLARAAHGVRVPVTALIFRENGMQVAKAGPDNKVILQPVRIETDFGTEVEIKDALQPGDRIIDNPPDSLQAGDTVRIGKPAATKANPAD